jgi:hypothetical protein
VSAVDQVRAWVRARNERDLAVRQGASRVEPSDPRDLHDRASEPVREPGARVREGSRPSERGVSC